MCRSSSILKPDLFSGCSTPSSFLLRLTSEPVSTTTITASDQAARSQLFTLATFSSHSTVRLRVRDERAGFRQASAQNDNGSYHDLVLGIDDLANRQVLTSKGVTPLNNEAWGQDPDDTAVSFNYDPRAFSSQLLHRCSVSTPSPSHSSSMSHLQRAWDHAEKMTRLDAG